MYQFKTPVGGITYASYLGLRKQVMNTCMAVCGGMTALIVAGCISSRRCGLAAGPERSSAELTLGAHTLTGQVYDDRLEAAIPQGIVDENPPWLHCRIPFPGDPSWPADRGRRYYHFKLSQDPTFGSGVITNTPRRWSFFNPHRKLANGTWHWTCGYSMDDASEQVEWQQRVYRFEIQGHERVVLPPTADEVYRKLVSLPYPRVVMMPGDFGALTEPPNAATASFKAHLEKILAGTAKSKGHAQDIRILALGYGATGDVRYRDEALARYHAVANKPAEWAANDWSGTGAFTANAYNGMCGAMLELMPEAIDNAVEQQMIDDMVAVAKNSKELFGQMLDKFEHSMYDSHIVQKSIDALVFTAMVVGDRHPEGEELFKYAYELWLYRSPMGGRHDGSWHNGLPYLSVNEAQLFSIPWVLGRITGYDYFRHPWYRNCSKFFSYVSARGSPRPYYADADWDAYPNSNGGPLLITAYLLAHIHPENEWHRWQSLGGVDPIPPDRAHKISGDMHRWHYLAVRKLHAAPDYSRTRAPTATAMAFRDAGFVGAHTDLVHAAENLMVTMKSSPFGTAHKSHEAQNAFTMSYGGEKLFFRTGWRKRGDYANGKRVPVQPDYNHSRAHNTIMPNGMGQMSSKAAQAFLARFVHGDRMTYWLGDASSAYPQETGCYRFRRHMVLLKPHYLLVYDELASTQSIPWTYNLNGHNEIKKLSDAVVSLHNGQALATANLFCSSPLNTSVTDQFTAPSGAKTVPNHWHCQATTTQSTPSVRFLNVITVTPSTNTDLAVVPLTAVGTDLLTLSVGDYAISAQISAKHPPYLEVRSSDDQCALLYGDGLRDLVVGDETVIKAKWPRSTLFLERATPNGDVIVEAVDQLPDAATYGNKY